MISTEARTDKMRLQSQHGNKGKINVEVKLKREQ